MNREGAKGAKIIAKEFNLWERLVDEAVQQIAGSWEFVLPEILLVVTACVHFLVAPFLVGERGEALAGLRHRWGGLALFALLAAAFLWWRTSPLADGANLGLFRADSLTWFIRGLALAAGVILLLASWNRIDDAHAAEHHASLLLITAGVALVGAANDLVVLFLSLELVSIATYVMLYLGRNDAAGQEGVVKYFLMSVLSSAIVLFGLSYLYGVTGTTNLTAMHAALAAGGTAAMPPALLIAIAAVVAGLGFRITAAPFHYYAPDVFQGTGIGGAAMLSFIPKIAGFVALLRLLASPIESVANWTLIEQAEPILWGLAILSMTLGNILALFQTNIWRLLAYSSVAHAGYMLVGLAVVPHEGARVAGAPALLFYLAVYGAMTVGVFAILAAMRLGKPERDSLTDHQSNGRESISDRIEAISDLAGLGRTNSSAALLMTLFLFSLTGLPPTAGFFAKLNLFLAAWSVETTVAQWTAVVMAVNAMIAAWYYLRIVIVMYLRAPENATSRRMEPPALLGAALCAAATIGIFIVPDWLWQAAARVVG